MQSPPWAEILLFGTTLEAKLLPPPPGEDVLSTPMLAGPPDAPGRPVGLGFREGERVAFPGRHEVAVPEARGRILHFFANHELLALELMALALLRFPEAPRAWRAGLVGVIVEEQQHLAAYLGRMEGTGVAFGDLPVNRYFWSALAGASSPLAFTAGLALTFEQANLDHAGWWARAFREAGDVDTAGVLDKVLADEIGHVRHGVRWFDRWRDPARSRWDAWADALPAPLTPVRGKGPGFSRAARLDAGLDPDTIERLALFGASKGRPPTVHLFNPGVEDELAGAGGGAVIRDVTADLAPLLMYLSRTDDVVLVPTVPSTPWLGTVASAGFVVPEWVRWAGEPLADTPIGGRTLGRVEPWARSPALVEGGFGDGLWRPEWRALASKTWSAARLAEVLGDGADPALSPAWVVAEVCRDVAEVQAALRRLAAEGHDRAALKAPLAAAGRGVRPVRTGDALGSLTGFVEETLARQGELLVEPWLDRVADLSVQVDIGDGNGDGNGDAGPTVDVAPWARFLTDRNGRYEGAILGRRLEGPELLRFAHDGGRDPDRIGRLLTEAARRVGAALGEAGYRGPAGVDAMIHRLPDGSLRLRPIVEVNLRHTMGRVALALQRRLRGGRVGVWRQIVLGKHPATKDPAAWAAAVMARSPLRLHGDPPLLDHGVLFTTDPSQARLLLTALAVGRDVAECEAMLRG